MKEFSQLVEGIPLLERRDRPVKITSVEYDSRRVQPGSLFVAMRGESTDGNRYIHEAMKRGAIAVVTDSAESFASLAMLPDMAAAQVQHGRRALAQISANFFHHPEQKLSLSGVTGTNGKTTTAFLLEGLLRNVQRECVLIGTIETHVGSEVKPSPHTTPESRDVLEIFADGVNLGATEAVMEISSHALEQERTWGLPVDVAIFTNLTQDHLDYHGTMDAYAQSKAKLFQGIGTWAPRIAIINADDSYSSTMVEAASECDEIWTYGVEDKDVDFAVSEITLNAGLTRFTLQTPAGRVKIESHLTGWVNVYNLTAAIAAAMARGLSLNECVHGASALKPVPGRFETVPNPLGIAVVVDYAHTEDALINLIALARQIADGHRVITVFGCGGDRDRTKRPKMGRAAGRESDFVIVTSDNPRSEDPQAIADEVVRGVLETDVEYAVELDRHAAIERAIRMARVGDIVLIAGKGHEKEQILRSGSIPFDDVAVARKILHTMAGEQ